jgi:hypothetical protein
MTANRIMILNCVLFAVIVGISVFVLRQENELPGPPPVEELKAAVQERLATDQLETTQEVASLENLGNVNLFDTIIPPPTPAPTPSPSPVRPPDIEEVIKDWKLSAVLTNLALFQNRRTKQDWTMKIGEARKERFRNKDLELILESVDKKTWSAVIKMTDEGITQTKKFEVF